MRRSVGLFFRDRDMKPSEPAGYALLFSSNQSFLKDNIIYGDPYRRQVQSYYDGLVTNGIISFEGSKLEHGIFHDGFFKIKGLDALQTVSTAVDPTPDTLSIEELLILAATTNNLEYPNDFISLTPSTNYQVAGVAAAGMFAGYWFVNNSPFFVPVLLTVLGKELISFAHECRTERPQPKLIDGVAEKTKQITIDGGTEIPAHELNVTVVVRPKLQ